MRAEPVGVQGLECDACKAAVNEAIKLIGSDYSVQHIEHVLGSLCNHLPVGKSTCNELVSKYTQELINDLVKHMDATAICQDVHFC